MTTRSVPNILVLTWLVIGPPASAQEICFPPVPPVGFDDPALLAEYAKEIEDDFYRYFREVEQFFRCYDQEWQRVFEEARFFSDKLQELDL
ncbi:hypothetical protein [uncultured Paracoccus sp.]|uniref:hypothetical protein n=1 Tax=uncultured Paracoccus sp. TaxID=189685 RepID=UPI0026301892|nr:hypothetical protein [uncultured Paracoccus sp.]